jgi:hypothetical protein
VICPGTRAALPRNSSAAKAVRDVSGIWKGVIEPQLRSRGMFTTPHCVKIIAGDSIVHASKQWIWYTSRRLRTLAHRLSRAAALPCSTAGFAAFSIQVWATFRRRR